MTETITLDGDTRFESREPGAIDRCIRLLNKMTPKEVAVVRLALTDPKRYAFLMDAWATPEVYRP